MSFAVLSNRYRLGFLQESYKMSVVAYIYSNKQALNLTN